MRRYIGDRNFYLRVLKIMLPIIIQTGITNFVSLLDNIMVGQVGTEQMSGVAITNQLLFIFQLCIFGSLSGAGIFCAQYYGRGDMEKIRSVFRFKVLSTAVITALAIVILWFFRDPLVSLFLTDTGSGGDLAATRAYGTQYLAIMLVGLVPFAAVQLYSSTMRETGETAIPMRASILAVLTNMVLNYILIFGKFGAPVLGVAGAAAATVISRFVEFGMIFFYSVKKRSRFPYFTGIYRTLRVPLPLTKEILRKGMPLLLNELLWSLGITIIVQCYSTRGLDAVAAYNISSTVANFFTMVVFSMGNVISILVGQALGAGEFEMAVDTNRKLIALNIIMCIVVSCLLAVFAPMFPRIYNTTDTVRSLAASLLTMDAIFLTARGIYNSSYFTLRSGGKSLLTFFFDAGSQWVINIPLMFCLAHFTSFTLIEMYMVVQGLECAKAAAGLILVRTGIWINDLTSAGGEAA